MSDRTKLMRKRELIFFWSSTAMWVGTLLVYIFCALDMIAGSKSSAIGAMLSDQAKQLLISIGTTATVGLVLAIVIKDKVRTAIWMASVILGTIVFGETAMYVTLGLWALDEYVLHGLYVRYKEKYSINREIDARG